MNIKSFIISKKQMELDMKLAPYDLWATKAHVLMLVKQKIISSNVAKNTLNALIEIEKELDKGKFSIDPSCGLHLTVEKKVIEKIGDSGYFMHTARSRNDQVATAELLYLREKALFFLRELLKVQKILLSFSSQHISTIMPGYTHMQPAKPTTFGQWCLSYFNMFIRCIDVLQYILMQYDICPLGSVESYGTSWKIDRNYTAKLLGFSKVWEIPQDAISSRGFVQLAYLGVLKDIGIVAGKAAGDLLLFNSFEYGLISLSEDTAKQMDPVTGSSVMPQKKNPDVLELIRASSHQVIGVENIVANLLSGLPMGYSRDTREVKEYIEAGFSKTEMIVSSLKEILGKMKIDKSKMLKAVEQNYSMATDLADFLAQKNKLPFRKVYKAVGSLVKQKINTDVPLTSITVQEIIDTAKEACLALEITEVDLKEAMDVQKAISKRTHIGGASAKVMRRMITKKRKALKKKQAWLDFQEKKIKKAKISTNQQVEKLIEQIKD